MRKLTAKERFIFSTCAIAFLAHIALLGFACFPVAAEADSSGIQYENALPTATGKGTIPSHSGTSESGGGGSAPSRSGSAGPGLGRSTSARAATSQTAKGGSAHSRHPDSTGVAADNHRQPPGPSDGSPAQTSSSAGSSPLAPILIAIAALAAVSIAAVMVRQRHHRHLPGPGGDAVQAEVTGGSATAVPPGPRPVR